MAVITSKINVKQQKKKARKIVAKKLAKALAEFSESMGKKKFDASIKKASKLFSHHLQTKKKKEIKNKVVKTPKKAIAVSRP